MNCNVIKDLLPLYADQCCSEESTQLVNEHLKMCTACRTNFEQMQKSFIAKPIEMGTLQPKRISQWKASLLQSIALFVTFTIITLGVTLEASTPRGETNGLWAIALIVPATGALLSLPNWFFLRLYPSRKSFSLVSCLLTVGSISACYAWAWLHYAHGIAMNAPQIWLGAALSISLCLLSKTLSSRYALLLGKE